MNGTIVRKLDDKGCGFIKGEDGNEYFFHMSALRGSAKFNDLRKGQAVTFEDSEGPKGPRAEDVYVDQS